MFKLALLAVLVVGARSQSVKSCGADSDHFKVSAMEISPDPPVRGQPFTITMTGELDADIEAGHGDVDLHVQALGIIKEDVTESFDFTMSPTAFKGGALSLVIGPWSPPSIPVNVVINGTAKATNTQGEPVFCLALDATIPAMLEAQPTEVAPADTCTTAQDHMSNIMSSTSGDTKTLSWTLDEDVSQLTVNADITIQELIKIPVQTSVPVSFTPGFAKGDMTITTTTKSGRDLASTLGLSVTGQIQLADANGEQVTCQVVDATQAEDAITV